MRTRGAPLPRDARNGILARRPPHTAGHLAARVKANEQLADDDPLALQLSSSLLERLASVSRFVAAALPLKVLPPRFNRYAGSGSYGDHVDNSIFNIPGRRIACVAIFRPRCSSATRPTTTAAT